MIHADIVAYNGWYIDNEFGPRSLSKCRIGQIKNNPPSGSDYGRASGPKNLAI